MIYLLSKLGGDFSETSKPTDFSSRVMEGGALAVQVWTSEKNILNFLQKRGLEEKYSVVKVEKTFFIKVMKTNNINIKVEMDPE